MRNFCELVLKRDEIERDDIVRILLGDFVRQPPTLRFFTKRAEDPVKAAAWRDGSLDRSASDLRW